MFFSMYAEMDLFGHLVVSSKVERSMGESETLSYLQPCSQLLAYAYWVLRED